MIVNDFGKYMNIIDVLLIKRYGMSSTMLPDYDWYAEFEAEQEPDDAVEEYSYQMEDYI